MGVAWLALILYTRQPHVSSCLCVLFPQAAFRQGARTEWNLLSGAADRGDDSNLIMSYYYTQTWPLHNNRERGYKNQSRVARGYNKDIRVGYISTVVTVMGPQKPLTMPECLLFNKSGILGKSSYYNCGNVVLL